jgi:molecular chaperone DnaK
MGIAVGIDLGTSNTVVACVRDGRAVTLPDENGHRLIPSIVSFHPNGSVIVGDSAKERRLIDPSNTIYSVKRLIGRSWASDEVQQARGRFPFELREGAKNSTLVVARGETYALPEMSAFVLRRAKAIAEQALGETVDRAVITVPANFNDLQRASTKVAGKLAGLDVLRILNEPTAAALAYGQTTAQNERLAVYDLGGGTFDITLLDLSGNVFEVLATAGDTALGGDDIDLIIADIIADQVVRSHRFDPRVDVTEFARLRIYAETLKQRLSSENEATIDIADLGSGEGGRPLTIQFTMTREELEREIDGMIERTLDVCRFAIETVNLHVSKLDRVIMVGGPTRMPLVQRRVQDFFGKPPALKVNPDEVVALGAAIQAHVLDRGRRPKGATRAPQGPITVDSSDDLLPRISAQGGAKVALPLPPTASAPPAPPPFRTQTLGQARPPPAPPPIPRSDDTPTAVPMVPQRIVALGGIFPPGLAQQGGPPPVPQGPPPLPEPSPKSEQRSLPDHQFELPLPGSPAPVEISLPRGAPQLTFDTDTDRHRVKPFAQYAPPPRETAAPPPAAAAPLADPMQQQVPTVVRTVSPAEAFAPALPPIPPPIAQPLSPARAFGAGPSDPPLARPLTPVEAFVAGQSGPPLARPLTPVEAFVAAPVASASAQAGAPRMAAPLLIDVTPLSLRVETVGGYCDLLIGANTAVPCDRTRTFLTAADGQTTVIVRVAQGESNRFPENTFLGELELTGLTPAPRGDTQIAVTFEIDADGILNVKARDVKSGRQTQARLQLLGAQTDPADLQEMMERQAQHAVM